MRRVSIAAMLLGLLLVLSSVAWAQIVVFRSNFRDSASKLDSQVTRLRDRVINRVRDEGRQEANEVRLAMQIAALDGQVSGFRKLADRADRLDLRVGFSEILAQSRSVDHAMQAARTSDQIRRDWQDVRAQIARVGRDLDIQYRRPGGRDHGDRGQHGPGGPRPGQNDHR